MDKSSGPFYLCWKSRNLASQAHSLVCYSKFTNLHLVMEKVADSERSLITPPYYFGYVCFIQMLIKSLAGFQAVVRVYARYSRHFLRCFCLQPGTLTPRGTVDLNYLGGFSWCFLGHLGCLAWITIVNDTIDTLIVDWPTSGLSSENFPPLGLWPPAPRYSCPSAEFVFTLTAGPWNIKRSVIGQLLEYCSISLDYLRWLLRNSMSAALYTEM